MATTTYKRGWAKTPDGKRFAPFNTTNETFMPDGKTLTEELNKMASTKTVTIPTSGWSSSAPYTQDVAVSGITASNMPEVYLHYPDSITASNAEAYVEAYGYINKVVTGAGKITVTAFYEKPSVDVTVMLKGV